MHGGFFKSRAYGTRFFRRRRVRYTLAMKRVFYGLVLPGLLIQLVGATFYLKVLADSSAAPVVYTITKVAMVAWLLFWVACSKPWVLAWKAPRWKAAIGEGLLAGFLMGGAVLILFWGFEDFFRSFAPQFRLKAESLNLLQHYLLFSVFLSVAHSLFEELYWRWFIFRGLQLRFNTRAAVWIGSVAFAGHHYVVLSELLPWSLTILFGTAVGVGGAIWCFLTIRTRTLLGAWISHAMVDGALMLVGYWIMA